MSTSLPTKGSTWSVVHDFCYDYGGAERVLETVARGVLPQARVWALAGDDEVVERMGLTGRMQFLLPRSLLTAENYRWMASLLAPSLQFRMLDENVLALSYAFCHYPQARSRKIVYCHSPMRQIWSGQSEYARSTAPARKMVHRIAAQALRSLDTRAAGQAETYVATSQVVRQRLLDYYGRAADIIPPPVDVSAFAFSDGPRRRGTYAWAGRIVEPYKRVGLLIEAFRTMPDRTLVIAGGGRDAAKVTADLPENVTYAGLMGTAQLRELYSGVEAVIFPSTDDFGITPVEAMSCGTPVIAYGEGGVLDTVVHGRTGYLFHTLSPEALRSAVVAADAIPFDSKAISSHAQSFSEPRFVKDLTSLLNSVPSASASLSALRRSVSRNA